MSNNSVLVVILASAVIYGTPLLYAALGELLAERSGVLNLGVEGMMLVGAVMGFWAVQRTGSLSLGVLAAAVSGAAMALIFAFLVVTLRANQIVSGLALTIFAGAAGLSSYLGNDLNLADQPARRSFTPFLPHSWRTARVVGPILFDQPAIVYASWICVGLVALYLNRTRLGLNVRAVGDAPAAADAMGINVTSYRYAHTVLGGAFAGVGGACFSLAITPQWVDGLTAGRRLDRDRARHLRVLASDAVSRGRVLLRRVLRHPVHLPGARDPERRAAGALSGAAVRDDRDRARAGLECRSPSPPRRPRRARHPVRARRTLAPVLSRHVRGTVPEPCPFRPVRPVAALRHAARGS